ncbi:MAG: hypothetical protein H6738_24470 [Alphaproteobacteria bacterium]|nr:hypothetical protein [Alphaproteobacteria bacterium]MCB9699965.1 hypothetical protein [Alphaproteobacteria bacterium]
MRNLTPLGHARVFRHPETGELVVDTDSLRRTHFAGFDDFGGWDDDDLEGYDDDLEGYDDDDVGLFRRDPERQRARRERRMGRKRSRVDRRYKRRTDRLDRKAEKWGLDDEDDDKPKHKKHGGDDGWGMTAVGGTDTLTAAGGASVRIRLQHDFRAEDITFTGSAPGALVTSIFFGDRVVWSAPDGIDVSVFASNGFLRGLLKGQQIQAGLDVTINGSVPDAGVFTATLTGRKPVRNAC